MIILVKGSGTIQCLTKGVKMMVEDIWNNKGEPAFQIFSKKSGEYGFMFAETPLSDNSKTPLSFTVDEPLIELIDICKETGCIVSGDFFVVTESGTSGTLYRIRGNKITTNIVKNLPDATTEELIAELEKRGYSVRKGGSNGSD